jgi:uncharacterized protein YndB with AHSA1/START domain
MAIKSGAVHETGSAAKPSLTLTRRLNAAPEKIFAAWTDPQKLVQWFGPALAEPGSVRAELDVRVGGHYRISFTRQGGEYFQVCGIYREVIANVRLVFSWAWHSTPERESLVTVALQPQGEGTLLTFHQEQFFDQAARDGHARGWTEFLGKLEAFFA